MSTETPTPAPTTSPAIDPGCLPAWGVKEMPAPPPFNLRNALLIIGPAAIALGTSIGSGEWLLGPAVTAKYGAALLWVATVSILLQVILNQEMMRYTIATGEPIFTGFLRTKPGPKFWGPLYTVLMFLQIGWPGWALGAATAITAAFKGSIVNITTQADRPTIIMWGYVTFFLCIAIIAFGGKIEKTLERAEWFMVAWILGFLLIVGIFFTSSATWGKVFTGFLGMGGNPIPQGGDWILLASFAAYAGMGGLGNGTITNWVRDKGWGMAGTVGHISGLIGGKVVPLSQVGNTFEPSPENKRRFFEWMKYAKFEQFLVFGVGCILGMGLPALMTVQFVPAGTDTLGGWATANYQAKGIGEAFGQAAWFLTLLNGFWILFSTQLGNTDIFARTVTDMLWSTHPRIQAAAKHDVRRIYFSVLIAFALFGMWAINVATPGVLIVLGAFIAALNFVLLGSHVLVVQKKFLPRELRMPLWRELCIYLFVLMFASVTAMGVYSKRDDIRAFFGGPAKTASVR
jgi:Mn2+/Fe2+ NRAMP family transporter